MSDQIFKPGYEGPRPTARLSAPEKQTFLQQKARLVRRLHDAMLTLAAQDGMDRLGFGSGSPAYIQEWGDRIGEEQQEPERARFRPTAAQVSDMDGALQLLEGLRPAYFKVVMLRALHEFARENGEPGDWPWAKIGAFFGMSDRWAESAYDAAIVQAARRAGVLDMAPLTMRARFIGDPSDGFSGPSVMQAFGFAFPKGEWVEVGEAPAKLRGSNHYEVEVVAESEPEPVAEPTPVVDPLDHDGDGHKGGSLSKAEIVERLKALGVEFDGRAGRDALAKVLAEAEAAEPQPE